MISLIWSDFYDGKRNKTPFADLYFKTLAN